MAVRLFIYWFIYLFMEEVSSVSFLKHFNFFLKVFISSKMLPQLYIFFK